MNQSQHLNNKTDIEVKRIKELAFYINESIFDPNASTPLRIELQQRLAFYIPNNIVDFTLRVYYHFPNSKPNEDVLMDIHVQNIFEIEDLGKYQIEETKIKLPPEFIITIIGLSISHTRALLAKNIAGTAFQDQMMAIINPEAVAMHFFPHMFPEKGKEKISRTEIQPKAKKQKRK